MIESIIILRNKSEWREEITKAEIVKEMNSKLHRFTVSSTAGHKPIINKN
ncbi:MAG: hypothetical protein IPM38_05845 [Ignavibacteria bacterium]|nr:hypothetical protein [Ignavibacteria bacterium]